jgi:hypothetical protein
LPERDAKETLGGGHDCNSASINDHHRLRQVAYIPFHLAIGVAVKSNGFFHAAAMRAAYTTEAPRRRAGGKRLQMND